MSRILRRSVISISLVVVALASSFLGFYQCGGFVWVKQAAASTVFVGSTVAVAIAAVDAAAAPLSVRLMRASVLAVLVFIIYLVSFRLGAYAYLAPASWGRFIDPSC